LENFLPTEADVKFGTSVRKQKLTSPDTQGIQA
jgi:hypothetical protein